MAIPVRLHGLAALRAALLAVIALWLLLWAPVSDAHPQDHALQSALKRDWKYRWGTIQGPVDAVPESEWMALGSLKEPPGRRGREELWLRVRLPQATWHDQWLFIHEMNHVFTVTIGGEEVYRYGAHKPGRKLEAPGWRWHMIPIPKRHVGKTLLMHVYSDDVGYIGPFGYVGIGTESEHLERMIRHDAGLIAVSALSGFIGLFAVVVYMGKRRATEYAYFALFALVASFYVLCRTEIKTFFLDLPSFWMRAEIAAVALMPFLIALHFRDIFHQRFHRTLSIVGWTCATFAVSAAVLDLIGVVPWYNSLQVVLAELLVASGISIVMALWSINDGLIEAKIVSIGVLIAGVLFSQSSLASLRVVPLELHLGHWGLLIIVLSLGVILIRRFMLTYFEVERNLRDRDARLSAVIDALPDSFLLTSRDGCILDYRLREEDAPILARRLPLGPTLEGSLPDPLKDPLLNDLQQTFTETSVLEVQVPAGNDQATFEVRTVPVGSSRHLSLIRNITERKRIERMSREFVAMVSHELRTPLTVIKGTLDLLKSDGMGLSPALHELVGNAKENSDRLVRLVNDLLDSQKIESGHFTIHPRPVQVATILEKAISLNRPFADSYRVALELGKPPPDLTLHADLDRLIQALTNLITNAVKFSERGGTVTVAAEHRDAHVRFTVTDRGAGVPEEFHGRIFQKFSQADSSNTRSIPGTGLGLSITKAIVEHHGGSVGFSSAPGSGSTFYLEIPSPRFA